MNQTELKALISYDPDTGVITHKRLGRILGYPMKSGHLRLRVAGKMMLAHRVAWLYMTGEWPKESLDHINRDPANNRWSNLRLATRGQNRANSSANRNNRIGLKGVAKRDNKFAAYIKTGGKNHYLGLYSTPEEAHAAYCEAAKIHFGSYFCSGQQAL